MHRCLTLPAAIAALWCASPAMSMSDQIVSAGPPLGHARAVDRPEEWTGHRPAGRAIDVDTIAMHANGACEPYWSAELGAEPNNEVWALLNFDDGTGPALYVGGWFTAIGGVQAYGIAKWNGTSWSALGSGMSGSGLAVFSLAVFDDGTGPALYAGGRFATAGGVEANGIAKWDGTSWSPLGSGVSGPTFSGVFALTVFDDGSGGGPALYAGGNFFTAGGVEADYVARWDGTSWAPLGTGVNGWVWALTVFDDGTGPALFAGGIFTTAGGVPANLIARWDGTLWSPLGSGVSGGGSFVYDFSVFDDGTGPALYAGGSFTKAGDSEARNIARWDGTSWSPLGAGLNGYVYALAIFNDGTGPALFAGGGFLTSGEADMRRVAKWDGESWSPLGTGLNNMNGCALAVFDLGTGPKLIVGGRFTNAGGLEVNHLASWDGASWSSFGTQWTNDIVWALTDFDDGTGPAIYAGGQFTTAGGVSARRVAKWNGASWSPLGAGLLGIGVPAVFALTGFDDGSGPVLYAAGNFIAIEGGIPASRIAKWDGSSWSPLGSGVNGLVRALTVFDDGTGAALYAGGAFDTAGGVPASRIAKWDGQSWSPLGSGMSGEVRALVAFDDGTGPALYAGGSFGIAGGTSANSVARWDGHSWSPLHSGVIGSVDALTVFDDGTGPAIHAGGSFTSAGGNSASRVAKWDGRSWSPLGAGVNGSVRALAVLDDGTGPALFAGGDFATAGGLPSRRIAKWDGSSWLPFGTGIGGSYLSVVMALAALEGEAGSGLYVGGSFTVGDGAIATHITKWQGCAVSEVPCPADVNGDGAVDLADLVAVLSAWGACAGCAEDLNDDGVVDVLDLFVVLEAWGVCS